ncbi:MAG: SH3 domain-containing protein [Clostridiales bacterium]
MKGMMILLCKKCGCELDETEGICPKCGDENQNVKAEDSPDLAGNKIDASDSFKPQGDDVKTEDSEKTIKKKPYKYNNYDDIVEPTPHGQNFVLKAVIIVMVVMIFTVGVGTIVYIGSHIRHDTYIRQSQLVELGATQGVSKVTHEVMLGKYFYVSGVTKYLPLHEKPSDDSKVLSKLYNGSVVLLEEQGDGGFWQVVDYASGISGYIDSTYLTEDPDKVIMLQNKNLDTEFENAGEKSEIISLYYVLNAGEGVPLYESGKMKKKDIISSLVDGNTMGFVSKKTDAVWRVYDYKSSQYGYVESKYLTDNLEALQMAKDAAKAEKAKDTPKDDKKKEKAKKGVEYTVTWGDSALSVRNSPIKEEGNQIGRVVYGDKVEVVEQTNDTFWYVYVPAQDLYGYVKAVCIAPANESGEGNKDTDKATEDKEDKEDTEE